MGDASRTRSGLELALRAAGARQPRTRRPSWLALLAAGVAGLGCGRADAVAGPFDPWHQAASYEIEYRVDLSALSSAERWRVWLPLPAQTAVQQARTLSLDAPGSVRVTRDALGNRFAYAEGHGVPGRGAALVVRFRVNRKPAAASAHTGRPAEPGRFLGPQRKIPLGGLIAQLGQQEGRGLRTDADKIRAFYDYVVKAMTYSKHGEGWGAGDAVWACTSKYGNCTDFHSLLIGMARSQGIPARFVIGFPIPSDRSEGLASGYHCWAELYDSAHGWWPVDASEAKKSGRHDAYFGALPSDRIEFTLGRDLTLVPPQAGPPLNFSVYPYTEVDGVRVARLPFTLRYSRLPARAEGS